MSAFLKPYVCVYRQYVFVTGLIIVWTILVFTAGWRHQAAGVTRLARFGKLA